MLNSYTIKLYQDYASGMYQKLKMRDKVIITFWRANYMHISFEGNICDQCSRCKFMATWRKSLHYKL